MGELLRAPDLGIEELVDGAGIGQDCEQFEQVALHLAFDMGEVVEGAGEAFSHGAGVDDRAVHPSEGQRGGCSSRIRSTWSWRPWPVTRAMSPS
ncbi:hypothetical protein GCM10027030_11330 [Luteococcus sediminum]